MSHDKNVFDTHFYVKTIQIYNNELKMVKEILVECIYDAELFEYELEC